MAKEKLELIHNDICGPIYPPTPASNRYFILFVDDFSGKMWVYMLKHKSKALEAFIKFQSYCESAGISRHLTSPYSSQQNGVVERRNRMVVEMRRSFLKRKRNANPILGRGCDTLDLYSE